MYVVLIIVTTLAFLLLLYKFIIFLSETTFLLLLDRDNQDVEAIMYSGCAPPDWRKKGLIRLGIDPLSKLIALRRISRLIRQIKNSPFDESEEVRKIAMDKLKDVRKRWKSMSWSEISPGR